MNNRAAKIITVIYLLIVLVLSLYLFMFNSFKTNPDRKHLVFSANNLSSIKNGTLVIAKKSTNININDNILFYNFYTNKNKILEGKIISQETTNENETTFELENNRFVSSSYVICNTKDAIKIPCLGSIFNTLTNTWGYLLFALIPTMTLFIFQLNSFLQTFGGDENGKEAQRK